MIRLFSYLHDWLSSKMLIPGDYEIVIRCKSEKAQFFLEHVIEDEFSKLAMDYPVYSPVRGKSGTCHGIKFEITT